MYPYKRKLHWWLRGRYSHLRDGIHEQEHLMKGPCGEQLARRLDRLKVWLVVRLVATAILSFSAISGITTAILDAVGGPSGDGALSLLTRIASSLAGLAALTYFFANRTMGMLEVDVLMLAHKQIHDDME